MSPRRTLVALAAVVVLGAAALGAAQTTIRIGEINSFSGIGAPFTGPYWNGVQLAIDEVNARGGVLGKKLDVLKRDDKGQPAEAVKHAQELVASEQVVLIAGTFLSNVGLAVSDWAKQNKTLFVAAEPLTEALTWSKGHDHVVRVRPNTYEQGRMLAEKAGKLKYTKWATIGPNYEYGKRAWETFRDRMKELKPDVQVVEERWPALGKIDAGIEVGAILAKNPEALYVSLFGSDWITFVREAKKRGLFDRMFVVGILLGEPEYIDPLARGHARHRLSLVRHRGAGAQGLRRAVHQEVRQEPGARLAGRLYHVPVDRRRDPQGGLDGDRQARGRLPGAEGRHADRADLVSRVRRAVDDGRLGGHDQARREARRRHRGESRVRAG